METTSNENVSNTNPLEKPAVSDKKREANRRNSLNSTGPKSDAGKKHSSSNALTYGLWSGRNTQLYDEDHEKFLQTIEDLRDQYEPVGSLEEFAVEQIAQMQRRLGRVWRFEGAAISLEQRSHVQWERIQLRLQYEETIKRLREKPSWGSYVFPTEPNAKTETEKGKGIEAPKPSCDQELLSFYEGWVSFLKVDHDTEKKMSQLEKTSLPKPEDLNTVLRAEVAAEKGLSRAIKRLEELQATRKEREKARRLQALYDSSDDVVIPV
jgi:hypothetical protein